MRLAAALRGRGLAALRRAGVNFTHGRVERAREP